MQKMERELCCKFYPHTQNVMAGIFQKEFMLLLKSLERRELEEFALNSISLLRDLEEIFKNTSLEYKLGSAMIKYSNRNYFYLTWILLRVALWHKIAQKIYGILSAYNPGLDNLEVILEIYSDNPLIIKCKKFELSFGSCID